MTPLIRPLIPLLCAFALGGGAREAEPENPPCLRYWGEARDGEQGFDHVVYLRNTCQARAVCSVVTDVGQSPVKVSIPAGAQREVVVSRASTSRKFAPLVSCRLAT